MNRKRKHDSKKDDNAPKSKQKLSKEVQEGEHLSKILFGGASSFLKSLEEAEQENSAGDGHTTDSGVGEEDWDEVEQNVQKVNYQGKSGGSSSSAPTFIENTIQVSVFTLFCSFILKIIVNFFFLLTFRLHGSMKMMMA